MTDPLGRLAASRPRITVALALGLAILAWAGALVAGGRLAPGGTSAEGSESDRLDKLISEETGVRSDAGILIVARGTIPARSGVFGVAIETMVSQLHADPAVGSVRRAGRSADGRGALLAVYLREIDTDERLKTVERLRSSIDPGPLRVLVGGPDAERLDARTEGVSEIRRLLPLSAPFILVALFACCGLAGGLAAALAAASAAAAALCVLLASEAVGESSLLGAGPAMLLAVVAAVESASVARLASAGGWSALRPVAAATLTVSAAAGAAALLPLGHVRAAALATAVAVPLAGLMALVLAPAFGAILPAAEGEPGRRRLEGLLRALPGGRAVRLARLSVAALGAAGLLILATPAADVRLAAFAAHEVDQSDSALAEAAIRREHRDQRGSEVRLLIEGRAADARLARGRLGALDGVADERVRPFGDRWLLTARARARPDSPRDRRVAEAVLGLPRPRGSLAGGGAIERFEARREVGAVAALAAGLAVAAALAVLLAFGAGLSSSLRILVAAPLAGLAGLGVLALVFGEGALTGPLGYEPRGGVGLGSILMVAFVGGGVGLIRGGLFWGTLSWWPGDRVGAVARATEAGLRGALGSTAVLVALSGALLAGGLVPIGEVALGVGAAVLLDLLVVRGLVLPALLAPLGRARGCVNGEFSG